MLHFLRGKVSDTKYEHQLYLLRIKLHRVPLHAVNSLVWCYCSGVVELQRKSQTWLLQTAVIISIQNELTWVNFSIWKAPYQIKEKRTKERQKKNCQPLTNRTKIGNISMVISMQFWLHVDKDNVIECLYVRSLFDRNNANLNLLQTRQCNWCPAYRHYSL